MARRAVRRRIQAVAAMQAALRSHPHRAPQGARPRRGHFIDPDDKFLSVPFQGARADDEPPRRPHEVGRAALRERPTMADGAVERDIEAAVRERIDGGTGRRAAARARVPGREDAAQHGDDGQAMAAAIAPGVDVPPCVTAVGDRDIEHGAGGVDRCCGLTGLGRVSIFHDGLV
jgi:hypothetical protein